MMPMTVPKQADEGARPAAMVASQVMRLLHEWSAPSLDAVWAARSSAMRVAWHTAASGLCRWYSSLISVKTVTSGARLELVRD